MARKALDICVGSYHPLVSKFLDPNVLPTEAEMDSIANKQWYQLAKEVAVHLADDKERKS